MILLGIGKFKRGAKEEDLGEGFGILGGFKKRGGARGIGWKMVTMSGGRDSGSFLCTVQLLLQRLRQVRGAVAG